MNSDNNAANPFGLPSEGDRHPFAFKKKSRESASQYVVRSIQEAIRSGNLKIGDALPSEMELAEKMGVGRSSIREGVRILTTFGILEVRQGKGTYIVDNFVESLFNMLGFSLVGDNLGYFLAARRVLECGCIKMNARRFSSKDLDELEELAEALSPQHSIQDNIDKDRQFHNKLIHHSGNTMMIRIYDMVGGLLWDLMVSLMCYDDVVNEARKAHLRIVEALRADDPQATERALSAHLSSVEDYAIGRLMNDNGSFAAPEGGHRALEGSQDSQNGLDSGRS